MVPTFGKDTIRRFSRNVTDMRGIAARDMEDWLLVIKQTQEDIHTALTLVQGTMKAAFNSHQLPAPTYGEGNLVWLCADNV